MLYFTYGSNLNMLQMKKRCPDSVPIAKVKLKGCELVFNRVADIIKSPKGVVHGAVYEVSHIDIKNLDIYEGYPKLYKKINVEVEDDKGKTYEAFVYVMVRKGVEEPSGAYYKTIKQGFKDWELPTDTLIKAREESIRKSSQRVVTLNG